MPLHCYLSKGTGTQTTHCRDIGEYKFAVTHALRSNYHVLTPAPQQNMFIYPPTSDEKHKTVSQIAQHSCSFTTLITPQKPSLLPVFQELLRQGITLTTIWRILLSCQWRSYVTGMLLSLTCKFSALLNFFKKHRSRPCASHSQQQGGQDSDTIASQVGTQGPQIPHLTNPVV